MRAIIGIGNPGSSYQFNKHNTGFLLIDYFAKLNSINFIPSKYSYYQASGAIGPASYVLIKPTTYVNKSGIAAQEVVENLNLSHEDLLVVCDDVYLDTGSFKVKLSGGDGGHNGLSSIIYHLNTINFLRIKIGVGRSSEETKLADHVLSDFSDEEEPILAHVFKNSSILIREFITGGTGKMLEANSKLYNEENENLN
ncbi:MAG: aminoacyl-tRNA hydrolase [Ignavibacteriaceae bacterium]|nr:aminoacyl-tRNA hydrolase [Ignavibacteriaceae bacterium]